MRRRHGWLLGVSGVAALGAAALLASGRPREPDRLLAARLAAVVAPAAAGAVPCAAGGTSRPWVLLALGQSNAGNHGAEDEPPAPGDGPRVTVFTDEGCRRAADPLPGATGRHRSVWSRLPAALRERGVGGDMVVAVLAVDVTSVADWTRPDSPLPPRLATLAARLRAAGLAPDRVLWQQGEADALNGTPAAEYAASFEVLRRRLRDAGIAAPIVLAKSTRCGRADGRRVRQAVQTLLDRHADLEPGPDTDALDGPLRRGCHFTREGLEAAAGLWADRLAPALSARAGGGTGNAAGPLAPGSGR